jgi:hypothetical protein
MFLNKYPEYIKKEVMFLKDPTMKYIKNIMSYFKDPSNRLDNYIIEDQPIMTAQSAYVYTPDLVIIAPDGRNFFVEVQSRLFDAKQVYLVLEKSKEFGYMPVLVTPEKPSDEAVKLAEENGVKIIVTDRDAVGKAVADIVSAQG